MTSIVVLLVRILGSHPRDPDSTPDNGNITKEFREVACIKYLVINRLKLLTRYYNLYLRNIVLNIVENHNTH